MTTKRDYYEVLGIGRSATKEEIKKAYRRMARLHHPDVNGEDGADEAFKEINEAHEVLSNERTRAAYDQYGHAGLSGTGGSGFSDFGAGFGGVADIFEEFFGGGDRDPLRRLSRQPRTPEAWYECTRPAVRFHPRVWRDRLGRSSLRADSTPA
jgi:DnaJ-class molecular chaperone